MIERLGTFVLRKLGYSNYAAKDLSKALVDDFSSTKVSFRKKLWAYRRGFLARRVVEYGLTGSTFRDYENDLHYFRLHPIDRYAKWIDDKLTFRYVLQPFKEFLPEYYFELQRSGACVKLMDCPASLEADLPSVMALLRQKGRLAVKLVAGERGKGFFKLESAGSGYFINDQSCDEREVRQLLSKLDRYVVTEYLVSHPFVRSIYPPSVNTVRLSIVHLRGKQPHLAGAFFRFGTKASGVVDNVCAGGLMCGIELDTGRLYSPRKKDGNRWIDIAEHPDTRAAIKGQVPHWQMICSKIREMCFYLSQLSWMGFDIIVTEDGFKVIEINSFQDLNGIQMFYPLLKDEQVKTLLYG